MSLVSASLVALTNGEADKQWELLQQRMQNLHLDYLPNVRVRGMAGEVGGRQTNGRPLRYIRWITVEAFVEWPHCKTRRPKLTACS